MKKIFAILTFLSVVFLSFAEISEDQVLIFKKNFHKGNLQDKIKVLTDAASLEGDLSEIFLISMDFVEKYSIILSDDPAMISLASITMENLSKVSATNAISFLSNVFVNFQSDTIKKASLKAIYENNYSDSKLNNLIVDYGLFLLENDFQNEEAMLSLVQSIEKLNDSVFFNLLFKFISSDRIPPLVRKKAEVTISLIQDNYKTNMLAIIEKGTLSEKRLALKILLEDEKNSDFLRAEIAEKALQVSILNIGDTEDKKEVISFQLEAIRELRRVAWTRSSELIVTYFGIARSQYDEGLISEDNYIEVIHAVSELASTKAGSLLSDYLAFFNSQNEQGISCSEPIVLAVINALGRLGNKVAFENLLYVGYLSYSEEIIEASRAALAGLKF